MLDLRFVAVVLLWYVAASTVALFALWCDKRAALRGGWRTKESTLHLIELLGGWPGTMLGQRWLRHKSRKMSYRLTLWLIVAVHIAAWALLTWRLGWAAD